jgi:hypothetical protein
MPNIVYNEAKRRLLSNTAGDNPIDLIADAVKLMAVTATYAPNADDQFIDTGGVSDPVDARASGTTDQALGTKSIVKDTTNDFAFFKAASALFVAVPAGAAIVGFVLYKDTGTPTTSPLVAYYDTADITPNGGDITFVPASDANGGYLKLA